eukprot:gene15939-18948_t
MDQQPIVNPTFERGLKTYSGSCHCGAIKFEVEVDFATSTPHKCNCTICTKSREWAIMTPVGQFKLTQGAESLSDYTFGSNNYHHRFCKVCGVKTHVTGEIPGMGPVACTSVTCIDLTPEQLGSMPIHYIDGANEIWDQSPAITSYL